MHLSLLSARRYALIQAQSRGDENFDSGEASVFFAATIPFIAILIVGLVGISRVNEGIAKVPVRMRHDCSWSVCVCVCVCVCVLLLISLLLCLEISLMVPPAPCVSVYTALMRRCGGQVRLIEAKAFSPEETMILNSALDKLQISMAVYGAGDKHTHTHTLSLSLSLSLSLPSPARPCTIVLTVGDGSQECR